MWTLHTANEEHWVPIKTVSSFKRMREYASKGHDWIVKALRTSEELEVDAAGENARRRTEVQPPKGQFERSIYAVSTDQGVGKTHMLMRYITERVWRRDAGYAEEVGGVFWTVWADERGADASCGWEQTVQGGPLVPPAKKIHLFQKFQGSVFVEFEDMKAVETFLNADPKPSWEGTELLTMSKCEILPFIAFFF